MSEVKKHASLSERISPQEDAEIKANARRDADSPPLSDEDIEKLVPITGEELKAVLSYKRKIEAMGKELIIVNKSSH